MAYSYVRASSESHYYDTAVWSGALTVALRFNPTGLSNNLEYNIFEWIIWGGSQRMALQIQGSGSNHYPRFYEQTNSGWEDGAVGTTDLSPTHEDSWHTWIYTCDASRNAEHWFDGTSQGTKTYSGSRGSWDRLIIGSGGYGGFSNYYNGRTADVGIWDAVLTSAERNAFDDGINPRLIRPESLRLHFPQIRTTRELIVSTSANTTGTPDVYAHPRVIYPKKRVVIAVPAAAAGTTAIAGVATGVGAVVVSLAVRDPLAGKAEGVGATVSALRVTAEMSGAARGAGSLAASLLTDLQLVGAATGTGTATASLAVRGPLAGAATGVGTVVAGLSVASPLRSVAVSGAGVVVVGLSASVPLAGTATGTGIVVASLTTELPSGQMGATATGTGTLAASLSSSAALAGVATGVGAVVVALSVHDRLAATAHGAGSITAFLKNESPLAAGAIGAASVITTISSDAPLGGPAVGHGHVVGSITVTALAGEVSGAAVGTGTMAGSLVLLGFDNDAIDNNNRPLSITARTDCDGATLRPPRVTLLHALDGARMASLTDPRRLDMDRYTGYSLRGPPASGYSLSLCPFTLRAGECFAPKRITLTLNVTTPAGRGPDAADTTQRTDADGATLHIPARYVFHAGESALMSNLQRVGEDRDRHVTQHDIPPGRGPSVAHSIVPVNDGRAGSCGVPRRLVLIVNVGTNKPLNTGDDI